MTLIFSIVIRILTALYTINKEKVKITDWFKCDKLHLNINKSDAMLFHPYQITINTYNNMIKINDKSSIFPPLQNFWASMLRKFSYGMCT